MDANDRYALTTAEWEAIKDLAHYTPPRGPKPDPDTVRPMLNGICWILGSGATWRDVPARFGPWRRVYARFRAYIKHGVFEAMQKKLHAAAFDNGQLKLDLAHMDGTYIRAHRHAAGAKKKRAKTLKPRKRSRRSDAPGEGLPPNST